MKPKAKILLVIVLMISFVIGLCFLIMRLSKKACIAGFPKIGSNLETSEKLEVVPTMNDVISADTAWCGTFQLVWNDMINEVIHQDVQFSEPLAMVEHLNQQDFNENSISEEYYYKKFGLKTLNLKNEIEKGIQEKFGENSDILENIDWSKSQLDQGKEDIKRYLFYTMLKRDFSYPYQFSKLEQGKFANQYENISYFGIDSKTDEKVRNQVKVLYYNNEQDCAVILNTVEGDQVILCKGNLGNTFGKIYENMLKKEESYKGNGTFKETDFLKVPEIDFDVKREYDELENKEFDTADGDIATILKAIQTIKMNLDEEGGSIKSEAVIDMEVWTTSLEPPNEDLPRYFYFDDEFTLFLQENGKEKPYFAMHVGDITKFQ